MAIRQVVYVSSGVREFSDREIADLLDVARRHNQANGITGVLFYVRGNFLQLLEGNDPALSDTLSRIRKDARHRGLLLLGDDEVAARNFSDFQMAFRTGLDSSLVDRPDILELIEGRMPRGPNAKLGVLFETFFRINSGRSF